MLGIRLREVGVVGAPGFEPGTSRTPSVRATRLRYAPTASILTLLPLFQKRQEGAQGVAQVEQHFAIEKGRHMFAMHAIVAHPRPAAAARMLSIRSARWFA